MRLLGGGLGPVSHQWNPATRLDTGGQENPALVSTIAGSCFGAQRLRGKILFNVAIRLMTVAPRAGTRLRTGLEGGYAVTADQSGSSVPRRQLGRKLRELREGAGLTVTQVITALEWSKPRLWRYETGQVPVHPNDVDLMCRLYGADAELIEALKALARETKAKGWWHDYFEIPEWFELFLGMEAAASHLRQYEAEVIPGLVQTPGYASAMIGMGFADETPSEEEVQNSVKLRMTRQRLLVRKSPRAPQLDIILSETSLHRGFGNEVMVDQLTYLLTLFERPNITIRVIPLTAGVHKASHGPFSILAFPRQTKIRDPEPTTVYREQPTGALYLDKPAEVATYEAIWSNLRTLALDQVGSSHLIKQRVKEWSRE